MYIGGQSRPANGAKRDPLLPAHIVIDAGVAPKQPFLPYGVNTFRVGLVRFADAMRLFCVFWHTTLGRRRDVCPGILPDYSRPGALEWNTIACFY